MSELIFYHGTVNSGKSTALLQTVHAYTERGFVPYILKPAVDTKGGTSVVSRIGISKPVDSTIAPDDSVTQLLTRALQKQKIDCIFVDEAQFLSHEQVDELFWFVSKSDISVFAYGLRTDFRTEGFPGSTRLLLIAHKSVELDAVCVCGKRATLNARKLHGKYVSQGAQLAIDDSDDIEYIALCPRDYAKLVRDNTAK